MVKTPRLPGPYKRIIAPYLARTYPHAPAMHYHGICGFHYKVPATCPHCDEVVPLTLHWVAARNGAEVGCYIGACSGQVVHYALLEP